MKYIIIPYFILLSYIFFRIFLIIITFNFINTIFVTSFQINMFFFYISIFLGSEYSDEYKRDSNRDRRESVAGLIPFPRVGRSSIDSALQMDNFCMCY